MDFLLEDAFASCTLCPRHCGAARAAGKAGLCGATADLRIARAALHFWEEPPISGEAGSGAIFFTGCPLRCIFCQNHNISQEGFGHKITVRRLAKIMLELQDQGALNINLVTPFHYAPYVHEALLLAKDAGLTLPIVANTSGYELPELVDGLCRRYRYLAYGL
jgi:putative pyruvate formate lyase activating enzyme